MKKVLIYIIIIFSIISLNDLKVNAGQMPQLSQYMLNSFYYNPAVAGTYRRYVLKFSSRLQWIGYPDAPQTVAISTFGPNKDYNMGYGGYVYSDNTGPISKLGLMGSYAYNIPLFDDYRLSFGLSAGMLSYSFDPGSIKLYDNSDPALLEERHSKLLPDANVGVYLYSYSLYAGFAAHQLFGNRFNYEEENKSAEGKLVRHYYLIGGYSLSLNRDWRIEPYAILQGNYPEKLQLELSAQAVWENMIWGGLSFRTSDKASSFTILGRYKHERKYEFGISYDLNVFSNYHIGNGSIEVVLGYWFDEL